MTEPTETTRTTIEVDADVWEQVRKQSDANDTLISVELEDILRQYFD